MEHKCSSYLGSLPKSWWRSERNGTVGRSGGRQRYQVFRIRSCITGNSKEKKDLWAERSAHVRSMHGQSLSVYYLRHQRGRSDF
jgi:hypothetical protein